MENHSQGIVTFCIMEAQDVRSKTKRRMGLRSGPLSCIGRNYITDSTLEKFYSPSGPLSRMPGYEFRPQQLELALAVQEFLRDPLERTFAALHSRTLSRLHDATRMLHSPLTARRAISS